MSTFLIVGASSGIGERLALQLSSNNHTVFASYCTHQIESSNQNLSYHYLNVLDETLNLNFLPDVVDGLAFCPGTINLKPFNRLRQEDVINDFQLQVGGAIKTIQAFLPKLKNSDSASIVLFSTVAVQLGLPFHTQVAISKGAIEGLTRSLAAELAPKIRVNCIAPSLTDTPLAASLLSSDEKREANAQRHPLKKIGTVEDIANMAEFLLTQKSKWMTGQILHVDGGMSTLRV